MAASSCITEAGIPACAKRKTIAAVMAMAAIALIAASHRERSGRGRVDSTVNARRWAKSESGTARAKPAADERPTAARSGRSEFIANTITARLRKFVRARCPRWRLRLPEGLLSGFALGRGRRLGALRDGALERRAVAPVDRDLATLSAVVAVQPVTGGRDLRARAAARGVKGAQLLQSLLLGRQGDPEGVRQLVVVHGHDPEASLELAHLHLGPGQFQINRSRHISLYACWSFG